MDNLPVDILEDLRCNGRITQTYLLKLNGRVPGMSLGSSFQRDLLYTAANSPKKAWGYVLHGFLYWREYLVNDMGDGLCHLTDFCCDVPYITTLQHRYKTLTPRSPGQRGQPYITGKIPSHI